MILNGLEVKKIRNELGLTQQDMADKLQVNIRTVQKWEEKTDNLRSSISMRIDNLRNNYVINSEENVNNSYISIEKDGVEVSLNELLSIAIQNPEKLSEEEKKKIAYIVAVDEDYYFELSTIKNSIEARVANRVLEIFKNQK